MTASAVTLAAVAPGLAAGAQSASSTKKKTRVFVGSHTDTGILAFDWDPATGVLTPAGVAYDVPQVAWLAFSNGHRFMYSASELAEFDGKPTGEVASYVVEGGEPHQLSARNSAGKGTCHVAIDHTGSMVIAADYAGGSAATFLIDEGALSEAVWTEHYTVHGPNPTRQEAAHAHFSSFSPDNRFAYINDLGGDMIHIYRPEPATAQMTAAGAYHSKPGYGPRTLHFHPNGHTAYCMYEMASKVDVLDWHKDDGQLTRVTTIDLLPADYHGPTRGCDTVISKDGRFVYFANRDDNFLYAFKADYESGALTAMKRSSCGGKTPRNFVLDPSEHWMLVANQDSNNIAVFARDPESGELAGAGKSYDAAIPMRILFT
ncbi:MAG: lactonase family protein [Terracidiphilus sp.]